MNKDSLLPGTHIQKHAILPDILGGNFFGRKKREEKEEIFEKLLLNFEIFFWNKDKLIEEIFEDLYNQIASMAFMPLQKSRSGPPLLETSTNSTNLP